MTRLIPITSLIVGAVLSANVSGTFADVLSVGLLVYAGWCLVTLQFTAITLARLLVSLDLNPEEIKKRLRAS